MRLNAALAKSREIGRGSAQSLKPAQMITSDYETIPVVPTPLSDAEGHKLMAEVVTKLGEAILAQKHKPAKKTGLSVEESMEATA